MPPGDLSTTFFPLPISFDFGPAFQPVRSLALAAWWGAPFGGGGEHLSSIRASVKSFVRLSAASSSLPGLRALVLQLHPLVAGCRARIALRVLGIALVRVPEVVGM